MSKRSQKPVKATATVPTGYGPLLAELKSRVRAAQVKAALSVNRELIALYWDIGRVILQRQQAEGWGAKVRQDPFTGAAGQRISGIPAPSAGRSSGGEDVINVPGARAALCASESLLRAGQSQQQSRWLLTRLLPCLWYLAGHTA